MTYRNLRLGVLALALLTLGCAPRVAMLHAQSNTQGAIAANVLDTTGAAISKATIILHNVGTNAEQTVTTDENGYFRAPQLQPGIYSVTIKAAGFGDFLANGVAVTVGSLTELHPVLKAGTAVESIVITGEAPVLQFESPEVSSTLTAKEIVDLPLNGGRWSDLALLTPGTVSDSNGFGLIVFRGISPLLNNVQIDGVDDNQAFFSEERGRTREGYSTSQISIAEFQVSTSTYSAEYGRSAGGVINSVTKSGNNNLHGQAYFYDRDNNWGAINPFTTYTSVTEPASGGAPTIVTGVPFKPKDWRKRWGFGAGGALVKDKLFWFYSYDQYKRNFPGVAKPSNPAAFFNQYADLALPAGAACTTATTTSGSTTTVSAKLTGSTSVGDQNACALAWRVYNGNYIQAAKQYDQLLYGNAVSSLTGLNTPGLLDTMGTTPRTGDEVLNTPKLDWQITQKHHASFLYHRLRWDSPGGVQTQTSNNYSKDAFGTDYVKLDYGVAKLDSQITSAFSNELRFQYSHELNWEGQQPHTAFTNTYLNNSTSTPVQIGIYGSVGSSTSNNGFTGGMPYYSFRTAYPSEWKDQVGDTGSYLYKNHTVRFGFDIVRNSDLINNLYESNGVYTYTTFSDFFADILKPSGSCDSNQSQMGLTTNGKGYACYYGYTQGFGTPKFSLTTMDYGFFGQDDWKLTPRLTVNLGLRYDYEHVPPPYPSLINSSLVNTTPLNIPNLPTASIMTQPNNRGNVGPRVGFAWDPFGNGRTVLRGGYGLYFGRIINGVVLNAYEAAGSAQGQYTIPSVFGKVPDGKTAPAFPNIIPNNGSYATPSVDFFAKHFKAPEVHEFDLSMQHELFRGTFVSVDYMGALGRRLPNFLNVNLNPGAMVPFTLTAAANSSNASAGCGPIACGKTVQTTAYLKSSAKNPINGQTGVYNTSYGSITEVIANINSSYNAGVIDIQNRGNKYAQFDINYTYSHALDYAQNQSTSPSTNNWYDPWNNAKANYGNSAYNVPSRFVAWGMLQYPGQHQGLLRYVEDGWHLNPIIQWQNGLPYNYGVSGTMTNAYSSGLSGTGNSGWILGRNTLSMPDTLVLDTRVQKDIRVGERFNVELLAEAFNLLNHVNVTGINGTAYSLTGCTGATASANGTCNLTYQPYSTNGSLTGQQGFGSWTNANSNFVYSQRQMQLGMKLDF